jgi:hypothetical protein
MEVFGRNFLTLTSNKKRPQPSPEGSCCDSSKINTTTVLEKLGIPGGAAAGIATVLWALFAPCHPSATTLGIPAAFICLQNGSPDYGVDKLTQLKQRPDRLQTRCLTETEIKDLFRAYPGLETVRKAKAKDSGVASVPISRGQIDLNGDKIPEDIIVICTKELDTDGDGLNDTTCPCQKENFAAYVIPDEMNP